MSPLRTGLPTALLAALLGTGTGVAQDSEPACRDATAELDADFEAYLGALNSPDLCLTAETFTENELDWRLITVRHRSEPGPLWAVPHDEEDEAFAGALYAVQRYGGAAVIVENGEQRLVGGFDPNHLFATTDSAAETCETVGTLSPRYVEAFLRAWNPAFPVIGLHSNWDGHNEAGGLGTISVYRDDDKMRPFPSEAATDRFADEDTVAMLVGRELPEDNANSAAAVSWLNARGVHVIFRHVTEENNGCTLADYLTLNELGFYINLEVERGDFDTQPQLIDRAIEFLESAAFTGLL